MRIISFRNPSKSIADIIVEPSIITMDFEPLGRELVAEKEKLNSISNLSSDESKRKARLNSTLLVFKAMLEFSDRHGLIDPKNFDEIGIWFRVIDRVLDFRFISIYCPACDLTYKTGDCFVAPWYWDGRLDYGSGPQYWGTSINDEENHRLFQNWYKMSDSFAPRS